MNDFCISVSQTYFLYAPFTSFTQILYKCIYDREIRHAPKIRQVHRHEYMLLQHYQGIRKWNEILLQSKMSIFFDIFQNIVYYLSAHYFMSIFITYSFRIVAVFYLFKFQLNYRCFFIKECIKRISVRYSLMLQSLQFYHKFNYFFCV